MCGCEAEPKLPKINQTIPNSELLNSNKCNTFMKSRGRKHKLCVGQNKNLRRRRTLNVSISEGNSTKNCCDEHPSQLKYQRTMSPDNESNFSDESTNDQIDIFQFESAESECTSKTIPPSKLIKEEFKDQLVIFPYEAEIPKNDCAILLTETPSRKIPVYSSRITKKSLLQCAMFNPRNSARETTNLVQKLAPLKKCVRHPSASWKLRRTNRKINECVNKLLNRQMMTNLVKKLETNNLTEDFVFSLQSMARGKLPIDTIPHLAHLEMMRFHRITDSRRMWYCQKMKKFWHCFYKVGGGPPLRLLSGPKGIGNQSYQPSNCQINFAVPSTNTIRSCDQGESPKFMPPSIFRPVIKKIGESITNNCKEFILSYDGKSVGTGLKGEREGDVDMWGFESDPNLHLAERRLCEEIDLIDKFFKEFSTKNFSACQESIQDLIKVFTFRIKDIRKIIDKSKRTELKYTKADSENPKYKDKHQYTIQGAQYLAANCRAIIQRALNVNRELCEIAANVNDTKEMLNLTGFLYFKDQPNLKILLEPEDIVDFFEECDDTVYVKQRSTIWKKIRQMCSVTGSTLHKAIGLGTLQDQKDHFEHKFRGKEEPLPTADIQEMLDYGTENEVS